MQRGIKVVEHAACSCWKISKPCRWITLPTRCGVRTPHNGSNSSLLSCSSRITSFLTSKNTPTSTQAGWRDPLNASPIKACIVVAARRDHWSRASLPLSLKKKKRTFSSRATNSSSEASLPTQQQQQQQPAAAAAQQQSQPAAAAAAAAVLHVKEEGLADVSALPPAGIGPSERVKEWDVEEMEKKARKMIKSHNFYGKMLLGFIMCGGVILYISYAASDVSSGLIRHLDGLLEFFYKKLPKDFPDPEGAHKMVMWLAARGYLPLDLDRDDPALSVNVKGLTFHTPVGLAAGFDKDAEAPINFCKMGFGFVEVGSITPKPQSGNPKPRIFRLAEDNAIINRCGFNSKGLDAAEPRLKAASQERWHDRLARRCVFGVNLGKNKESEDAESDVREGVRRVGRFADYIVINLSSPNTKGLRALQQRDHLKSIINAAQEELKELESKNEKIKSEKEQLQEDGPDQTTGHTPEDLNLKANDFFPNQTGKRPLLFVKIAPDLSDEEKRDIAQVALETNLDGLVVTNTTIGRPDSLRSENKNEIGGLSGRPLKEIATKCVFDMYKLTNGKIAIIASGGIETGLDAFKRIKAGASVVEIYTSLIYRGPGVARRIKDELLGVLNQAGISSVQDAVGLDHRPPKMKPVKKPTFD